MGNGNHKEINFNLGNISVYQSLNLFWIDPHVNNSENIEYQNLIKKIQQINLYAYTNIEECLKNVKNVEYKKTYIIISGSLAKDFFIKIKKDINEIKIIPVIIIFTSQKRIPEIRQNILNIENCVLFDINLVFAHFIPIIEQLKKKIIYKPIPTKSEDFKKVHNCFSFEYINNKNELILPLHFNDFMDIPNKNEIIQFNKFLLDKYSSNNEMKDLIEQLFLDIKIPYEILVKYWLRAYTINTNFSDEMNFCLEKRIGFAYDTYIKILYQGLLIKSITPTFDKKLFKGDKINKNNLLYILKCLKYKKASLPGCICYNKTFLLTSKDINIAFYSMQKAILYNNEEYVLYEIENNNELCNSNANNIDLQKISFIYKYNVLIFPFSSFEITKIEEKIYDNQKFFLIKLNYLGKYRKIIDKSEKIPETKFTQDILKTELLDKYEMKKESYKFNFNIGNYINNEKKRNNYIVAEYKITNNDLKKNINILNCSDSNFNEISKICEVYSNKVKMNFTFKTTFTSPGKYIFVFVFNELLTNASRLFYGCKSLISLDLNHFKTNYIKDMNDIFNGCTLLESLDLSSFKTEEVKTMRNMFLGCHFLKNINLSNFNTVSVIDMSYMFGQCESLTFLDLSNFNTKNVKSMAGMFFKCCSLKYINLSRFFTNDVYDMSEMFYCCSSIKYLDLSNFDTYSVTNMSKMFSNCSSLLTLDLSKFNTSNVTTMENMFSKCSSLPNLDLSNFNTKNVKNINEIFSDCSSLYILNLSNFNAINIKNSDNIFFNCTSLKQVNVSNFISSNVYRTLNLFKGLPPDCEIISDVNSFNKQTHNEINLIFTDLKGEKYSILASSYCFFSKVIDNLIDKYNILNKENLPNFYCNAEKLDLQKTVKENKLKENRPILMINKLN